MAFEFLRVIHGDSDVFRSPMFVGKIPTCSEFYF
ncbi:hypothetical protein ACJIZ3_006074 [Penstemon smallii]|uniref:Uncharacterized protein n=1 Tax=Penstemon smallii TaxID=265156 RepID=A0ABD3S6U2_9LAMI